MLTRKFAFFCVFLGFNLMADVIPGMGNFTLGGLPLLILVSGWRYAAYYVGIILILDIPFLIQRIPVISSLLKFALAMRSNPQLIQSEIHKYVSIPTNSTQIVIPHVSVVHSFPIWALAIGAIGLIALEVVMLISFFKSFKFYIRLLRRARQVARISHR